MTNKEDMVNFGFKKIPKYLKDEFVSKVFSNVADKYDLMNDLMSLGIHRIWKDEFVKILQVRSNHKILDLGGGTGDIAFRILKDSNNQAHITVADINEKMLEVGKKRAINKGILKNIEWDIENGEQLSYSDDTYDIYTTSFCIRNITDIQKALDEAYRVLKPGGRFFCLEFSKVNSKLLAYVYNKYSLNLLPLMGKIVVNDSKSYRYLAESIEKFYSQEEFKSLIKSAGFENVGYKNLSEGISAIHWGIKPNK